MASTTVIHIRASREEVEAFGRNADLLSTTKSALGRALIAMPVAIQEEALSAYGDGTSNVALVVDKEAFARLTQQIRRYGHHYNQAVHALNTVAAKRFLPPDETEAYMRRALAKLDSVDGAMRGVESGVRRIMGIARAGGLLYTSRR